MLYLVFDLIFLIFSIFILIKNILYSNYEIKKENNKFGGLFIVFFTIFSILFSNIILWINQSII